MNTNKRGYKIWTKHFLTVFYLCLSVSICGYDSFAQTYNDSTLASVRQKDAASRDAAGRLQILPASEHIFRADVYMSNRDFAHAREHYQRIIENYKSDQALMPRALFGMARSFMWEKQYVLAVSFFDDLVKNYPFTKDGREGLAFKGACLVRLEKPAEAARVYEQYTTMFPTGERIESSYLNVIDALREAGKTNDALDWINKIRARFPRTATETNAVFAKLRLEINQKKWLQAAATAAELQTLSFGKGAMTNQPEAAFFKAYSLEKNKQRDAAIAAYLNVPDNLNSYYGAAATERLQLLIKPSDAQFSIVQQRLSNIGAQAANASSNFPAPFRDELLRSAAANRLDPRFVLAIMKQESSFRPDAKSPAAARGLLQLTVDTAAKYVKAARLNSLQPEDLYRPSINIAVGSAYLAELQQQFPNLPEAVAASYNGGEDNAARWQKRAAAKEPFIFTSEVGFAESKDYVFKVMSNYRAYRELYTADLRRK